MSVVTIKRQPTSRTFNKDLDKLHRKYTETYKVKVTNANDDPNSFLSNGSLPQIGTTTYASDSGALCVSSEGKQGTGQQQLNWYLTYTYDSQPPWQTQENPLDRPPVVSGDYVKLQDYPIFDLGDVPILSTNGETYENLIPNDKSLPVIVVEKNYDVSSFDWNVLVTLADSTNDDTVTIPVIDQAFDAYVLKLEAPPFKIARENNIDFVTITWKMIVNWELWKPSKYLATGLSELNANGALVTIYDRHNNPISKPQLINEDGRRELDANGKNITSPFFQEFVLVREADWTPMGF